MVREVTGRRMSQNLTVLLAVLVVLLAGYVYWIRNDEGTIGILYMVVPIVLMVVATVMNVGSLVRLSKMRARGRFSYRLMFAYGTMVITVLAGISSFLLAEVNVKTVFVVVSFMLLSVLNLFLVRWVDLHRDLGRLSEWFILGESVSVDVSGHRYIVFYLGVFIAATLSGVFGWISVRGNGASEGLVTMLTMLPSFIFGIAFTIMSIIIVVDTCVGKLSIRAYREHVLELVDGNGEGNGE